jgi:hypothetical protein
VVVESAVGVEVAHRSSTWTRNHDFHIAPGMPWRWRCRGVVATHPSMAVHLGCDSVDQEQQFPCCRRSSVDVEAQQGHGGAPARWRGLGTVILKSLH